jgi:hypothetical protein
VRTEQLIIAAKALRYVYSFSVFFPLTLSAAIVRLKQAIPFTIRYTLEGFDISVEQRRIDRHLDTLCLSPVDNQIIGRDFTDDLKPFLVSLVQSCHYLPSTPPRSQKTEDAEPQSTDRAGLS